MRLLGQLEPGLGVGVSHARAAGWPYWPPTWAKPVCETHHFDQGTNSVEKLILLNPCPPKELTASKS